GIETELDQNQVDAALAGKVALARGNGTPTNQGSDLGYNFRLAGAPKINGELPLYVGEAGWGFAAPKNANNPDIALEFLKMMATEEGQRGYSAIYGGNTPAWAGLVGDFSHFASVGEDSPNMQSVELEVNYLLPQTRFYGEGFGFPAEV